MFVECRSGSWGALDGIDAVGKTSQIRAVQEKIGTSFSITTVPEFSSCHVGTMITTMLERDRFFSLSPTKSTPRADTLALLTDMEFQFESIIKPTIAHHGFALSDRGPGSLISYQAIRLAAHDKEHFTEDTAFSWVLNLINQAQLHPDVTEVMQVGERVLQERVQKRGEPPLTSGELDFLLHVNTLLIRASQLTSHECHIIDAEQPFDQVTDAIIADLREHQQQKYSN